MNLGNFPSSPTYGEFTQCMTIREENLRMSLCHWPEFTVKTSFALFAWSLQGQQLMSHEYLSIGFQISHVGLKTQLNLVFIKLSAMEMLIYPELGKTLSSLTNWTHCPPSPLPSNQPSPSSLSINTKLWMIFTIAVGSNILCIFKYIFP